MQKPYRGPKSIPSQVQLPGGIVLRGMPFKIVAYNADGSPRLFELQPPGGPFDIKEDDACVLFAREDWIRSPALGKASTDAAADTAEPASMSDG
jgi:hypothetical protein